MSVFEYNKVTAYALKLSHTNAQDYVQEAIIKVLRTSPQSPFAFMLTAIRNIHLDHTRSCRTRLTELTDTPPDIADVDRSEQWVFEEVVSGLTPDEMAILTAKIHGVTLKEISQATGIGYRDITRILSQIKSKCTTDIG
jgi:RNA polymerase sigma factor (sigma-70 family)